MSTRDYFSLRYAIPGYTMILIVIAINYVPIFRILEMTKFESVFGAFFAFLSLFAGSTLGFLTSQLYWWRFLSKCAIFGVKEFEKTLNTLIEKYKLVKPPWNEETKKEVYALFDYVDNSVEKGKEKLFELEARRWDMYHLLSITIHTSCIGLVVGVICRIYSEYFLFEHLFSISFSDLISIPFLQNAELIALLLMFFSVISILLLMFRARQWIITEYATISAGRIRRSKVTRNELREAFPKAFPDTSDD